MTAISGSAAAVTGGASGIGRALARELAARGCDLALADRDEAGLASVAAELAKSGRKVTTHRVDVSEPAQLDAFAAAAIAAHPTLNILINNAGVALLGQFNEIDQAQFEWLMILGRRSRYSRLSPPTVEPAGGAHCQHFLNLRHHRPSRPDRLLRVEIRRARLFRGAAP